MTTRSGAETSGLDERVRGSSRPATWGIVNIHANRIATAAATTAAVMPSSSAAGRAAGSSRTCAKVSPTSRKRIDSARNWATAQNDVPPMRGSARPAQERGAAGAGRGRADDVRAAHDVARAHDREHARDAEPLGQDEGAVGEQ